MLAHPAVERRSASCRIRVPGGRRRSLLAVDVDEFCTKRVEGRTGGVDAVRGLAETDTEGIATFVAGLCRLQEGIQLPIVGVRRRAGDPNRIDALKVAP